MTARARLLAAAAACLAAATAVYLLAVRTTSGQTVENLAMDGRPVDRWWVHSPAAEGIAVVATVLAVGGAVAVVAWSARRGPRRRAVAVAASIAASLAATEVLKHLVVDRPALVAVGDRAYLRPNTFPSGHSAVAVAVAVAAVALAPRGRRAAAALAGGAYAAAVGLATLAAEVHRPADVAGAALVSTAVGLTFAAGRRPAATEPEAAPPAAVRSPAGVAAALAVIGAAAALALALPVLAGAAERGRLTGAEIAQARAAGAVVVAGASLAGVGAFAWMTRAVGRRA